MSEENTYEMLWDCKYCGTRKLLGLTHRCCPSCGAPQDQASRYFPSDEEKIRVQDHQFAGADVLCPACKEANGLRSRHCRHCGSPLAGAEAVARRGDQVIPDGAVVEDPARAAREDLQRAQGVQPAAAPVVVAQAGRAPRSLLGILAGVGCSTVLVAGVLLLVIVFLWRRDATLEVVGHGWERSIEIESFGKVREEAWCDEKPAGARELARTQAQRSTRKVQDGEDCKTRKRDQGDGTYKETRECQPRFREEPVLAERCTFEVSRWKRNRVATSHGSSLAEAPRWPDVGQLRRGTCEGCEREGQRTQVSWVNLRESGTTVHRCEVPESRWVSYAVGSRWHGKVRKLTGGLACDSLRPAG